MENSVSSHALLEQKIFRFHGNNLISLPFIIRKTADAESAIKYLKLSLNYHTDSKAIRNLQSSVAADNSKAPLISFDSDESKWSKERRTIADKKRKLIADPISR